MRRGSINDTLFTFSKLSVTKYVLANVNVKQAHDADLLLCVTFIMWWRYYHIFP